ncbi:zinc finger protein 614-like [Hyperolius riggenbachi]|uniref:zinc finger protein 614-like n=1 Tax=Hyperolius riggenbachi TaxID=752182 RepID=UPI0035A2FC9C
MRRRLEGLCFYCGQKDHWVQNCKRKSRKHFLGMVRGSNFKESAAPSPGNTGSGTCSDPGLQKPCAGVTELMVGNLSLKYFPDLDTSRPSDKSFPCSQCKEDFVYYADLLNHRKSHVHPAQPIIPEKSHSGENSYRGSATSLGSEISFEEQLESYNADNISELYESDGTIYSHGSAAQGSSLLIATNQVQKCETVQSSVPLSDQILSNKKPHSGSEHNLDLVNHSRPHFRGYIYSCSECGDSFVPELQPVVNGKSHTGEKWYLCPVCEEELLSHEKSHIDEKSYSCTECGDSLVPELRPVAHGKSHSGLVNHRNSHCGGQLYSSPECVRCFVNNTELLSHWKSHTDEKTYSCSECGKCFVPDALIVTHERSRTVENLYLCSECEKCSDYHIYTLFQNPESETGQSSTLVPDQGKSVGMR